MCLVVLAWQQHLKFPLIVAGNRDEFHSRPTEDAHWWPDQPAILGGRDLQAGGTWMALHNTGRFAAVTNFRDAEAVQAKYRSRGHLVTDFLNGNQQPMDFLQAIDGEQYAGFNLLVCDGDSLAWFSNRDGTPKELMPGIYGLSNALLDSPWHKVTRAKSRLRQLLDDDNINRTELQRLLSDREKAPVQQIDSTRLPFRKAHAISAPFIVLPDYGTRSSTVVTCSDEGEWRFNERRFNAEGQQAGDGVFAFAAEPTNRSTEASG